MGGQWEVKEKAVKRQLKGQGKAVTGAVERPWQDSGSTAHLIVARAGLVHPVRHARPLLCGQAGCLGARGEFGEREEGRAATDPRSAMSRHAVSRHEPTETAKALPRQWRDTRNGAGKLATSVLALTQPKRWHVGRLDSGCIISLVSDQCSMTSVFAHQSPSLRDVQPFLSL